MAGGAHWRALAGEVENGVICHVDDRGFCRRCLIGYGQCVRVVERVGGGDIELTGISRVTIRAAQRQDDTRRRAASYGYNLP